MMNTFIGGTLAAMWSTHTSTELVKTYVLDDADGTNVAVRESALAITGTGVGSQPDPGVALCISFTTAVPRRRGRGRMFLPAPDGSHFTNTGLFVKADCQTLANAFKAARTTFNATSTASILHRKDRPLTSDPILSENINATPADQRRRKNKVPPNRSIGV
jgi:hypothetical protein